MKTYYCTLEVGPTCGFKYAVPINATWTPKVGPTTTTWLVGAHMYVHLQLGGYSGGSYH